MDFRRASGHRIPVQRHRHLVLGQRQHGPDDPTGYPYRPYPRVRPSSDLRDLVRERRDTVPGSSGELHRAGRSRVASAAGGQQVFVCEGEGDKSRNSACRFCGMGFDIVI